MKKYKRALSLLLIICIMCCAVFGSVEFSNALVLNPWTIAICGALLTAAGLSFSSSSDMEAAAGSFAGSVSASIMSDLQAKAEEYKASNDNGFFLTLGADIISAISGWLSGVTAAEGGSVSLGDVYTLNSCSVPYASSDVYESLKSNSHSAISYGLNLDSSLDKSVCYQVTSTPIDYYLAYVPSLSSWVATSYLNAKNSSGQLAYDYDVLSVFTTHNKANKMMLVFVNSSGVKGLINVVPGSLSIPFSDVWAPDSEDKSKALVPGASVKLPKGLVQDGALDSDVIGSMTPESVRAGTSDIPDVIAGTGTITGTGEGTGIFEGIGSLVLDIPIIGTIASTLSEILEAIKGFFDVSRFDLNFESLKVGLTGVFPFCIPFDFFNAVKMFSSDASSFVFDINLETEYFTIDHTVDLTPFRLPILFFRYVVVFWFGFILISRTKDFMKW